MAQTLRTDWTLFLTIVFMVCLGLVAVYSASSMVATLKFEKPSYYFLLRQGGWAVVGFAALLLFKRLDYRRLAQARYVFGAMGVVLFLLLLVYFVDSRSHRWFRLGGVSLQPSELAKPALALFLAWFVSRRLAVVNNRYTLIPAGLAVVLMGAVVVISDLGTAVVLVATAVSVFFVAGIRRQYLAIALAAGLLGGFVAVMWKPYRLVRVLNHFESLDRALYAVDPHGKLRERIVGSVAHRDPTYQLRQSKIAIGSGGVFGLGPMQGKQKLLYLPEAHTDFIYAVVGEETGLLGCVVLLTGFLIIAWKGFQLFWLAPDDFGRYLALAITVSIVFQAFMNLSVVLGLAPTKGIPLPMISNGGSSLVATLTQLGMLLSVSERAV